MIVDCKNEKNNGSRLKLKEKRGITESFAETKSKSKSKSREKLAVESEYKPKPS
jgi:hypothetical protein